MNVKVLWDTGAEVSVVNNNIINKLKEEKSLYITPVKCNTDNVTLKGANGKHLEVINKYRMRLNYKKKRIQGEFFVVKDLGNEVIMRLIS